MIRPLHRLTLAFLRSSSSAATASRTSLLDLQRQLVELINQRSRDSMAFIRQHPQLRASVMQWLAQPGPTQLPELSTALARLMEAGQVDCVQGLVEALQLQPGQTVLEIGFGTGHALQLAAQREPGAHLYGVDISQTSLELCQQRLGKAGLSDSVKLQLADVARQLPFAADTFDTIYHLNCIYFWQPLQRGLAECLRVLKPGGRMVTGFKATSIAQGLNFDVDGADSDKGPFRHVQENRVLEDIAAAGFIQTGVLRRDDFDFFGRRYQLFFHQKPASS